MPEVAKGTEGKKHKKLQLAVIWIAVSTSLFSARCTGANHQRRCKLGNKQQQWKQVTVHSLIT